jgi:hypothetical protein
MIAIKSPESIVGVREYGFPHISGLYGCKERLEKEFWDGFVSSGSLGQAKSPEMLSKLKLDSRTGGLSKMMEELFSQTHKKGGHAETMKSMVLAWMGWLFD